MALRFLFRRRRRRPETPKWLERLDPEERRRLARNLRRLVESKAELERGLNENARPS
jgi:hypothetical protein